MKHWSTSFFSPATDKGHRVRLWAASIIAGLLLILVAASALTVSTPTFATGCTSVSTSRGSLMAAVVAITGQTISSDVDATGCDIGVYVGSGITGVTVSTTVHDANKFGVYNDGGNVTVTASTITNTGNHTGSVFAPNGVQTGIGVLFDPGSTGSITGNTLDNYQKGGILVKGASTSATIDDNIVAGLGPVHFIAQNGIEVSSATAQSLTGNTVSKDIYTQNGSCAPAGVGSCVGVVATGILLINEGSGLKQGTVASSNHAFGNQANVTII